ncbi:MAG: hypothetical protein M1818_007240 [Claussenomyces sp. TS43310]|nr:MAG: hypothetical protein M1818_007240 [Claussenomyces sp. TS43310]
MMIQKLNEMSLLPEFSRSTALSHENAELIHNDALDAARIEHQRVREAALRAFENNELAILQLRLREQAAQETKRLMLERERAQLAARVIELQRTHIPLPKAPHRPPTPPRAETPPQACSPPAPKDLESSREEQRHEKQKEGSTVISETQEPKQSSPPTPPTNQTDIKTQVPLNKMDPLKQVIPQHQSQARAQPLHSDPYIHPGASRYLEIHQQLKRLRAYMKEQSTQNPNLKKKMSEGRRVIRMSIGQLTEGKGANKQQMSKILTILKDAHAASDYPVEPGMFIVTTPSTIHGVPSHLPGLFIWLLNVFSKMLVKQLIDEAGVSPKAADPIGVLAVSIFAQKDLLWRESSLIDILIAKMRVVCPVLFGLRGNEKTEEGRKRLGWWKLDGRWVEEQVHYTRMTGLGAGFAAIALRDFSKSALKNPYPPSNYWQSMASILNTPDPSSTQYLVVKAMIENYEQRFLAFYGSFGKSAFRLALIDFPSRAPSTNVAASALKVLGDKLRRDVGLRL